MRKPSQRKTRAPSRRYSHQKFFPFARENEKRNRIAEIFAQNRLGKVVQFKGLPFIQLPQLTELKYNSWERAIEPIAARFNVKVSGPRSEIIGGNFISGVPFCDSNYRVVFTIYRKTPRDADGLGIEIETKTIILFNVNPIAEKLAKAIAETKFKVLK